MSKLAKVDRFFKNVNLTSDDEVFVGVDVHKKSYHVALFLNDTPAIDFRMAAEPKQLNKKLGTMACSIKEIVYEAGPTGYGLARDLIKNNLPASVVATSRIPRPAGAEDKTDRLDSRKLAEYSAKGLLCPIRIPTPKQEADRQLYRMRHRQALQFAKVKVQIKSFLLMHSIKEPDGLANWTIASVGQLRNMCLIDTLRLSLDELLSDYDYFNNRIKVLNKILADNLNKGVLGQRISQSGEKSSTGSINKAANGRLRNNLIQGAWIWVRTDIEAKKCFYRICDNCGGIRQKAIVAMARKMSGHLWAMLMNDQPYDKNKAKCRHNNER